MAEELSEYQKHKQKVSKEKSQAQESLKVVETKYEVMGNKIKKVFKKNNGNSYTTYVGPVKVKEKIQDRLTGRETFTPVYRKLVKSGELPDIHKLNKKG